jgi:hypothetical protein
MNFRMRVVEGALHQLTFYGHLLMDVLLIFFVTWGFKKHIEVCLPMNLCKREDSTYSFQLSVAYTEFSNYRDLKK